MNLIANKRVIRLGRRISKCVNKWFDTLRSNHAVTSFSDDYGQIMERGGRQSEQEITTRELNWCSMMSRDFAQASTLNIRFILYLSSLYFVCRRVKIVFLSRIFRNNYWYGSESDLSLFFRCFNEAFHVFILSVTNKDIRSSINCIFISCKNCLKNIFNFSLSCQVSIVLSCDTKFYLEIMTSSTREE